MSKMEMPKPTEHHEKLKVFEGTWSGHETLYPSPWAPEKRTATGRFTSRVDLDGMFLITDYTEERDGEIVFRGHGVYGYDARRGKYTMYWFDSMGMSPAETLGTWEGDTLTFENETAHGKSRYVYEFDGPDAYTFRILSAQEGAEWTTFMEGTYVRMS